VAAVITSGAPNGVPQEDRHLAAGGHPERPLGIRSASTHLLSARAPTRGEEIGTEGFLTCGGATVHRIVVASAAVCFMRYLPTAVIAELTPGAGTTKRRAKSLRARDLGRNRTVRAGVGHRDYFLCFAMRALWLDENSAGIVAAVTGLRRV
jgi:prophage tail gpP-like protein